jgi:adenylate kinase
MTGNPGVGKHTIAEFVVEKIEGAEIIDINKIAIEGNAILRKDTRYGIDIDIKKLSKLMTDELRRAKDLVITGHLAPYVLKPTQIDLVIILRRSPYELTQVFEQRKYLPEKIRENVASEILDIYLYDALKNFGKDKIAEFDTTGKTPKYVADEIISLLQKKRRGTIGIVDWLSLVYKKGDVKNFLEY